MKVQFIDSKLPFKFCGPRVLETMPEGAKFFTVAALIYWAPILLYSITSQKLPLFYVMLCGHALGVLIGILLHERQHDDLISCVPESVPAAQEGARLGVTEKAA